MQKCAVCFATDNWYGVFAPAGTPAPIIERMHAEIGRALSAADVKKHLLELGIIATASASPAAFSAYIAAETEKWGKIARAAGVKGD